MSGPADRDRLARNADSKADANHDREIWSNDEIDLLMTWDRTDDELTEMGLILGRTREACRERYYCTLRNGRGEVTRTRTTTTTDTTTVRYGNWDPADVSPWYA